MQPFSFKTKTGGLLMKHNNEYLEQYDQQLKQELNRGPAGWFRKMIDRRAQAIGQPDRHALFLKRVLELAGLNPINKPIRILEIGCGNGWAISYISTNIEYYAIDRGDFYGESLKNKGVKFLILDVNENNLPYEDRFFDLVMLNHVIEHISNYERFLKELYRVSVNGGYVYIRTPDISRVGHLFFEDYTHIKPYTMNSLNSMMGSYGFKHIVGLFSDHARINLDVITNGKMRKLVFGKVFGGKEAEGLFKKV